MTNQAGKNNFHLFASEEFVPAWSVCPYGAALSVASNQIPRSLRLSIRPYQNVAYRTRLEQRNNRHYLMSALNPLSNALRPESCLTVMGTNPRAVIFSSARERVGATTVPHSVNSSSRSAFTRAWYSKVAIYRSPRPSDQELPYEQITIRPLQLHLVDTCVPGHFALRLQSLWYQEI